MVTKVYLTNKRGRSWKATRTAPVGDAVRKAELSTRHGFGWDASPVQGGGDVAPSGYGFLRIGSPSSNQLIRVGSDSSAPRILIATGA